MKPALRMRIPPPKTTAKDGCTGNSTAAVVVRKRWGDGSGAASHPSPPPPQRCPHPWMIQSSEPDPATSLAEEMDDEIPF